MIKKIISVCCIALIITGCTSSEKETKIDYQFELNTVFGIEKSDSEQTRSDYSTHAVQNKKLLVSRNELNHAFTTELVTKELFLIDIDTQEIESLMEFDTEIRVWDYVLIEGGFLYSTVESTYYDHLQNGLLKFKVIENINGEERVLDEGTSFDYFKSPSFHFIDNVIYYAMESFRYVDNKPEAMLVDLVRYENGVNEHIISIENALDEFYYADHGAEKFYTMELSKGQSSVGFASHILGEDQSNVYVIDGSGTFEKKLVEGTVTDLLLFENRTVYELIELTEQYKVVSVDYYDLKNNKKLLLPEIDDNFGRIVVIDENTLGFVGQGSYPYLVRSDKDGLHIHKVVVDGVNHSDLPFIYPIDKDRILLAQFPEEMPLKLSIIDVKEVQVDN